MQQLFPGVNESRNPRNLGVRDTAERTILNFERLPMKKVRVTCLLLTLLACQPATPPSPPALDADARAAIADTVRQASDQMLVTMRGRKVDEVLAFYGKHTAYVGNGVIGDWGAILAGAPPRYATYTRVDCRWGTPFRIDVLSRTSAVVTAMLDCQKADTSGRAWREVVARTEVLAPEEGRWRIVAVHESIETGKGALQ